MNLFLRKKSSEKLFTWENLREHYEYYDDQQMITNDFARLGGELICKIDSKLLLELLGNGLSRFGKGLFGKRASAMASFLVLANSPDTVSFTKIEDFFYFV